MPTAEENIYNRLASAPTFHPANADLFANDWALEPGDVVTVQSGQESYSVPVYSMNLEWKGNSKVNIQSTGNQKRDQIAALSRRTYGGGGRAYEEEKDFISQIGSKSTVYRQWADPALDSSNNVKAGDIWIKTNAIRTWANASANTFASMLGYQWRDQYGSKMYVRTPEGTWELQNDDATVFEQNTEIKQTKEEITLTATQVTELSTETAELKVTATEIRATVTSVQADQTVMQGQITVNSDKVSMVVEETEDGNRIRAAEITASINDSGSSVIISADHIDLDGYVRATDITTNYLTTKLESANLIKAGGFQSTGAIYASGNITSGSDFLVTIGSGNISLLNAVSALQVVDAGNNTYKIQRRSFNNSTWQDVPGTFSRATSLSGAWSGSDYVVTASPQDETLTISLTPNMYPNGSTDIFTTATLPSGAISLGTLANAINGAVGRRIYVCFYAGVSANGNTGARKIYALAIN